jgi:hypothetical protein
MSLNVLTGLVGLKIRRVPVASASACWRSVLVFAAGKLGSALRAHIPAFEVNIRRPAHKSPLFQPEGKSCATGIALRSSAHTGPPEP